MKFTFETSVERMFDPGGFHVLPVPDAISDQLRDAKISRLLMTIRDVTVRKAIQGPHSGGRYLTFSKKLMKTLRMRSGDSLTVSIEPDPDPDLIEMPVELEFALEQDKAAKERWETFTLGRKRSMAYSVGDAKQTETRIRRAVDLVEKIRTYNLYGDRKRDSFH